MRNTKYEIRKYDRLFLSSGCSAGYGPRTYGHIDTVTCYSTVWWVVRYHTVKIDTKTACFLHIHPPHTYRTKYEYPQRLEKLGTTYKVQHITSLNKINNQIAVTVSHCILVSK